jgi:hypothetical protein
MREDSVRPNDHLEQLISIEYISRLRFHLSNYIAIASWLRNIPSLLTTSDCFRVHLVKHIIDLICMARRPSTVSVASFGSTKNHAELSHSTLTSTFAPSPLALKFPRSVPSTYSSSVQSTKVQDETTNIDPDELFVKCTIPEVRAKQIQLRCVKTYPCQSPWLKMRFQIGC